MEKVPVLYITGTGHSGTTLLCQIIGTTQTSFSVGEVKFLESFLKEDLGDLPNIPEDFSFTCDCSRKISSCPFWSKVLKKKEGPTFPRHLSTFEKLRLILGYQTQSSSEYTDRELYHAMLNAAREIKNENVCRIIDASKDVTRLSYLLTLNSLQVGILHIVRDGRAVVNSHQKRGYHWLKSWFDWFTSNVLISMKKHTSNTVCLTVSYEEFTMNPEKHLEEINNVFDISIDLETYIQDVEEEEYHQFAGNLGTRDGIGEIYYDDSWKEELSTWKQWILTILCFIPNQIWVYNSDSEPEG